MQTEARFLEDGDILEIGSGEGCMAINVLKTTGWTCCYVDYKL